eukprot:4019816-Pyramimonas_sp.AAC.1
MNQIHDVHRSGHPWGKVAGPCGATFLALKQLGWAWPLCGARIWGIHMTFECRRRGQFVAWR